MAHKKKTRRILDIVDFQHGFVMEGSDLPVPNAEETIAPAHEFLEKLQSRDFALALFKYDTHFSGEYSQSPESESFPNIHCEWYSEGWHLVLDYLRLSEKLPVYFMTKNTFDMWDNNPVDSSKVTFEDENRKAAYENLYVVTTDPNCVEPGETREAFFARQIAEARKKGEKIEIVLFGHASDFCVHDAIKGYLKFEEIDKIVVLEDLCRGIGLGDAAKEMGRAPTGHIRDVVQLPDFCGDFESGRLRVLTSGEYLAELAEERKFRPLTSLRRRFGLN